MSTELIECLLVVNQLVNIPTLICMSVHLSIY